MNDYTLAILIRERQQQLMTDIRGAVPSPQPVCRPSRPLDWRSVLFRMLPKCPLCNRCSDGVLVGSKVMAK